MKNYKCLFKYQKNNNHICKLYMWSPKWFCNWYFSQRMISPWGGFTVPISSVAITGETEKVIYNTLLCVKWDTFNACKIFLKDTRKVKIKDLLHHTYAMDLKTSRSFLISWNCQINIQQNNGKILKLYMREKSQEIIVIVIYWAVRDNWNYREYLKNIK